MKIKRHILTVVLIVTTIIIAAGIGYGSARAVFAISDEVVNIPDPVLQNAIRDGLYIHERDIQASDMARINKLEISNNIGAIGEHGSIVTSLDGLEYCLNLEQIFINGDIRDLTPLRNLNKLESLMVIGHVQDLTPLANLTNLKILVLTNHGITDISPLSNLSKLEVLILSSNQIQDISPLTELYQLQDIALDRNNIADLSPLLEARGFTDVAFEKRLLLRDNPLSAESIDNHIPELVKSGVKVSY